MTGLGVRGRLTLLLGLAVVITLALAWFLTRRAVWEPFAKDVVRAHVEQVIYIAQEIESGKDPEQLAEQLGLELHVFPAPPKLVRSAMRGDIPCRRRRVRGRRVLLCPGPGGGVLVSLREAARPRIKGLPPLPRFPRGPPRRLSPWLSVKRLVDVEAAQRRVVFVLLSVALVVLLLSGVIASLVTRPIRTSVEAMERMASGDLRHRLPEGSSEAGEVARAFNRMADQITTLLEAERSLMAGISHELRTPLARLRLELELLRGHDVADKRLDAMESDVEEIDRLIGEVLESSRLAIGEKNLNLEPLDLREVAEEALSQVPLPNHDVELSGEATPLTADRKLLVRVAKNLLENAGKYAPPDTRISVTIDARVLTVSDQGPGVPAHELHRLFEPFYRGERGRQKGSSTGYGLGLMISRQIAELHGGRLEASTRNGGGLQVRLELPSSVKIADA